MSTRSYICIEKDDGKYSGVYCHHDGYLTYNGAMLIDHYNNRQRVEKLISQGDLSALDERIDPDPRIPHSFDNRQEGVTVFYGRDRGEKGVEARDVKLEEIDSPDSWIEYCYVYGKDDKWRYFECGKLEETGLVDLEPALEAEYSSLGIERPEGFYGFLSQKDIDLIKEKEAGAEL